MDQVSINKCKPERLAPNHKTLTSPWAEKMLGSLFSCL